MQTYGSKATQSDIVAYEFGEQSISILTVLGWVYLYTEQSAGKEKLAEMRRIAQTGEGLSSFIRLMASKRYAGKRKLEPEEALAMATLFHRYLAGKRPQWTDQLRKSVNAA